ncbi:hypothetical protein PCANC_20794 [Puccinia coronata f. sp. avenae]|uniref:No apical meristem-associated C-terminal domain-containing protein n=1 Tax=Puccinia coronata f. sp. avenae TaxID=200324 RepID=A0A2N5U863_9BASI|nr:hypothetical protein PCANC_20794 [Puccinia coronata f. sp. avenae]
MPSATPFIDPALSSESNADVVAPSSKTNSAIAVAPKEKPRKSLKRKSPAKNDSKSAIPKDIDSDFEDKKDQEVKLDDNTDSESDSDEDNIKKSSRARNYNGTEDKQLCDSWLDTTQNSRKGTDQKSEAFWDTVAKNYSKHISDPVRTAGSLKNRWSILQRTINKFVGCVNQINHKNPSGASAKTRLSMALSLYSKIYNKPFPNLVCYNILSNAPKWNEYCHTLEKKNNQTKKNKKVKLAGNQTSTQSTSVTSSSVVEVDGETSGEETCGPAKQPIGRKKAKDAVKEESVSLNLLKKMSTAHSTISNTAKRQNDILEAQQVAITRMANKAIMSKDLNGLSNLARSYYESEQKKIIERLQNEANTKREAEVKKKKIDNEKEKEEEEIEVE